LWRSCDAWGGPEVGTLLLKQALVIVMEDKTLEAEAFEPLISCPF